MKNQNKRYHASSSEAAAPSGARCSSNAARRSPTAIQSLASFLTRTPAARANSRTSSTLMSCSAEQSHSRPLLRPSPRNCSSCTSREPLPSWQRIPCLFPILNTTKIKSQLMQNTSTQQKQRPYNPRTVPLGQKPLRSRQPMKPLEQHHPAARFKCKTHIPKR